MCEPCTQPSDFRGSSADGHEGDDLRSKVAGQVASAREAQATWAAKPISVRLRLVREIRSRLAVEAKALAATVRHSQRTSIGETLAAEILPLADACWFLERQARRALKPKRISPRGRPFWLRGVGLHVCREPWGVVLIISPGNYPLLLPGVQALQALVAGNAVVVKPGPGSGKSVLALARLCHATGLDPRLLCVLPEAVEAGRAAIATGVDKVFLTGSATTGQAVLADLAPRLTPATMELSGCDAVFVQADADVDLVVKGLVFGLRFNGSATCIAPRRVFIHDTLYGTIEEQLADRVAEIAPVRPPKATRDSARALVREAIDGGARLIAGDLQGGEEFTPLIIADVTPDMRLTNADVFAPVLSLIRVVDDDEALAAAARCPYALGATVFGKRREAEALAARVRAGCVVVNDMLVPTADPRLPFGGRGRSGFGVTRGLEGLMEMTAIKAIAVRQGGWTPHMEPPRSDDARLMLNLLRVMHAGLRDRLASAVDMTRTLMARRKTSTPDVSGDPEP